VAAAILAAALLATWLPGAPLDDRLGRLAAIPGVARGADLFDRWVEGLVPLLFLVFLIPGVTYGFVTGVVRATSDVTRLMVEATAGMAPVVVLAFFAAQFIEYFKFSNLDRMLASSGGAWLAAADLPPTLLLVTFVGLSAAFDLLVVSMSAKWAAFAPVFVPMFMVAGISPELTQCAYRIGDSVANLVTPLNPYVVLLLVATRRYAPRAGVGTLVAAMVPYAVAFAITWTALLVAWITLGIPLGPGARLWFTFARTAACSSAASSVGATWTPG
jgi:aminobenzoyl-glutamate transport protein